MSKRIGRYWALEITFCDHNRNGFVALGRVTFKTKQERDAYLATIPEEGGYSPFIIDVWSWEGTVDDKSISRETVERLLGDDADVLVERAWKRWDEDQIAERRANG